MTLGNYEDELKKNVKNKNALVFNLTHCTQFFKFLKIYIKQLGVKWGNRVLRLDSQELHLNSMIAKAMLPNEKTGEFII